MSARVLGLSLAFAMLVAPIAHAQDVHPDETNESQQRDESRAAFRRGVTAVQKQKWAEARDDFIQAYKLYPHPSILLDLGVSRSHVGDWVAAEQDLTRFLAEDTGATPDELQTARGTLSEARKHLGTVRVRVVPAGSTALLDDKPIALVADALTDLRVTLGSHTFEASAPDHETWSGKIALDASETKVVDLTLVARGEKPVRVSLRPQRIAAFALYGSSVVFAGFGIFAGVHSLDLAHQYNTPSEASYQSPSTKSDGITFRTAADVTFTIAIACVVAGTVLYVTVPKAKTHIAIAITPFGVTGAF